MLAGVQWDTTHLSCLHPIRFSKASHKKTCARCRKCGYTCVTYTAFLTPPHVFFSY
ncbi:hypothetical protein BGW80DRAFT_1290050, partial [Lactifluus volemus]